MTAFGRLVLAAATIGMLAGSVQARMGGGGHHGGGHEGGHGGGFHSGHPGPPVFFHRGPRFFFEGSFYPFLYPPYLAPYPYWDDYYGDDDAWAPEPPDSHPSAQYGSTDQNDASTYGLIQLPGVPDGAAVDLDHRYWLEARDLDHRWLALPSGTHTITVRAEGYAPLERRVDVAAGRNQVVRLGPLRPGDDPS